MNKYHTKLRVAAPFPKNVQMYVDTLYTAKSKFERATCTSKAVFLLLVTKNRSQAFIELQISSKEQPNTRQQIIILCTLYFVYLNKPAFFAEKYKNLHQYLLHKFGVTSQNTIRASLSQRLPLSVFHCREGRCCYTQASNIRLKQSGLCLLSALLRSSLRLTVLPIKCDTEKGFEQKGKHIYQSVF